MSLASEFKRVTKAVSAFGKVFNQIKTKLPDDVDKTVTVHIVPVNKYASQDTIESAMDSILEDGKAVAYFCARKHIEKTEANDIFRCSDYGLAILRARFNRKDYKLEVNDI